jgi:hypothetical protein
MLEIACASIDRDKFNENGSPQFYDKKLAILSIQLRRGLPAAAVVDFHQANPVQT